MKPNPCCQCRRQYERHPREICRSWAGMSQRRSPHHTDPCPNVTKFPLQSRAPAGRRNECGPFPALSRRPSAHVKFATFAFDVGLHFRTIGRAILAELQADKIANQNLVSTLRVIAALHDNRGIGGRECDTCTCQFFLENHDFGAEIGVFQIIEERENILDRANAADPGAIVARGSGKGIDIAGNVKPRLEFTIGVGDAIIAQQLFGPCDNAGMKCQDR